MARKKYHQLLLYVDASYLEEIKEALGAVCWNLNSNEQMLEGQKTFQLGNVKNSMHAEYKNVEYAVDFALREILHNISPKKVKLKIITDNLGLSRVFQKLDAPPVQSNLSRILKRLTEIQGKFHEFEIFWREREQNPAGKVVEQYVKEYRKSDKYFEKLENVMLTQESINNLNLNLQKSLQLLNNEQIFKNTFDGRFASNIVVKETTHHEARVNVGNNTDSSHEVRNFSKNGEIEDLLQNLELLEQYTRNAISSLGKLQHNLKNIILKLRQK